MLIDTHVHLGMEEFDADRREVIERAIDKLVTRMIEVGDDLKSSQKAVELTQKWPAIIWASVGVHPHWAKEVDKNMIENIKSLAKEKTVVAIGEIGLDYAAKKPKLLPISTKEKNFQMGAFVSQLHLAASLDLPVIIHCREAHEDTISLLKDFVKLKKNYTLRGVVHSFAGTLSQAQEYLRLGLCISFTANITYPNRPRHVSEVLEQVPLEKIMVETDSPFLPPQSHRGARNEPSMVWEVVGEIAAVKGISISEVEERTTQTAKNLFGIK